MNKSNLSERYPLDNPHQEQLFNKISKELRCTVCQNQSIWDSHAPIAIDLRKEVYRQVKSGQTENEIVSFMVQNYGEDIIYRPPIKASTSILWVGPVLMVILGVWLLRKFIQNSHSKSKNLKT